jgi:hypothetical protein
VRFVTHRQIGDAECETLLTTLREISGR